jgi:hypothetical protein
MLDTPFSAYFVHYGLLLGSELLSGDTVGLFWSSSVLEVRMERRPGNDSQCQGGISPLSVMLQVTRRKCRTLHVKQDKKISYQAMYISVL